MPPSFDQTLSFLLQRLKHLITKTLIHSRPKNGAKVAPMYFYQFKISFLRKLQDSSKREENYYQERLNNR